MLQMRPEQYAVFEQRQEDAFFLEAVQHLTDFAPAHSDRIGPQALEVTVKYGLERCDLYGFSRRGPAKMYLELMVVFGSFFDEDPQYLWASEILQPGDEMDQMARAATLHKKAGEYFEQVYGADSTLQRRALLELVELKNQINRLKGSISDEFLIAKLQHIHKERVRFNTLKPYRELLGHAETCMKEFGLISDSMKLIIFVLMIGYGFRFYEDPQFPWVNASRLANETQDEGHEKKVESRMSTFLDAVAKDAGRQVNANS